MSFGTHYALDEWRADLRALLPRLGRSLSEREITLSVEERYPIAEAEFRVHCLSQALAFLAENRWALGKAGIATDDRVLFALWKLLCTDGWSSYPPRPTLEQVLAMRAALTPEEASATAETIDQAAAAA